jgi:hypothetical protein
MTMYEPNPDVRPTGAEAGEFADDVPTDDDDHGADDPTRRPTGSAPLPDGDESQQASDLDGG